MIRQLKNWKTITGALALLVVLGAGYMGWRHYDEQRGHEEVEQLFNDVLAVINKGLKELYKVRDDVPKATKMIQDFNQTMESFIKKKLDLQKRYPSFRRTDPEFYGQHQALFDEVVQAYFRLLRAGIAINRKNPDNEEFREAAYRGKYMMEALITDASELKKTGLLKALGIE